MNWPFARKLAEPARSEGRGGPADAVQYVDWLLGRLLRLSPPVLCLRRAVPLPDPAEPGSGGAVPSSVPTHDAVTNRLKILCGMAPVRCAESKTAHFERPSGGHTLAFEVRFDDAGANPSCTVRLRVKTARNT